MIGIGLALIILLGRKSWPGVMLGSLMASTFGFWYYSGLAPQQLTIIALFVSIGYTLEAVLGNFIFKRYISVKEPFNQTRDVFIFLLTAIVISIVGTLFTTSGLVLGKIIQPVEISSFLFGWWFADLLGILVFTPFIIFLTKPTRFKITWEKLLEISIFLLLVSGLILLFKNERINETLIRSLPILIIPFMLWLAFRFSIKSTVIVTFMAVLVAIYFTINGQGPFVMENDQASMLFLQIYIAVLGISVLALSATVKERELINDELEVFNENLETKVFLRTRELNKVVKNKDFTEKKLKASNQKLRKINNELDNFVYKVSHDLRAPISSILGLLNLAESDHDRKMMPTYLDLIKSSALQQDHFIKEIIEQSRNSRIEVRKEEINFQEIIDQSFETQTKANNTRDAEKLVCINQEVPFISDEWRMKVIFNNIFSNSIRYKNGQSPLVKVDVNVTKELAKISITDNGKGIARQHMRNVYKMFYRATDENAGSGLGLYIVKEAIEKLQGDIKIESKEGEGTTVLLKIPGID